MGGYFNPVVGGLSKGFALAQILKDQAIADAREQRAKEDFERNKAIQEAEFKVKAAELGGRAPTGADLVERTAGYMLDAQGNAVPSDMKERLIKSPGGVEFVLPTAAERRAMAAQAAKDKINQEVEAETALAKPKARSARLKTEAEEAGKEDSRIREDNRKAAAAATKYKQDAEQKALDRVADEKKAEGDRKARMDVVTLQQKEANKRNAATNARMKQVAEMKQAAKNTGAKIEKELDELDEISLEIDTINNMVAEGVNQDGEKLTDQAAKSLNLRLNKNVQRWQQITGKIERKTKLAEGGSKPSAKPAQKQQSGPSGTPAVADEVQRYLKGFK